MSVRFDRMRRHPVIAYFILAFSLSWAVWVPMAVMGARVYQGQFWPTHIPGLFGPMAAALVMSRVVGGKAGVRDVLRRMAQWRVAGRWYLVALSPLLFYAVAIVALAALGQGWPDLRDMEKFSGLPLAAIPLMWLLLLMAAYGEETGWRGIALPQMLKTRSLLSAAVVIGLLWALWHGPSMLVIENYREMGLAIIPMFTLGIVSGSMLLAWLYCRSGGSILIVALWHSSYNLVSGTAAGNGVPAAIVSTAVMMWAVVLVVLELRRWRMAKRHSPPLIRASDSGAARAVSS